MTISLEHLLENSFVISVDKTRLSQFMSAMSYMLDGFGLFAHPKVVDGYVNRDLKPTYRCSLSHVTVIRMAKAIGLPFVCIFEDDAWPMIGACRKLDSILRKVPDDAKIIVLGYNEAFLNNVEEGSFSRLDGARCTGSHAYVVFMDGYDDYIRKYDSDPNRHADFFFESIDGTYVSNENMFIQANYDKSVVNGWSGYVVGNKSSENPPDGFPSMEQVCGIRFDIEKARSVAERSGLSSFAKNTRRCLLVGSCFPLNASKIGGYVDSFDGDVIRCLHLPFKGYEDYHGKRTDVVFADEWYDKNVVSLKHGQKAVVDHQGIIDLSRMFMRGNETWLTTEMALVIMAISVYDSVYVMDIFPFRIREMFASRQIVKTMHVDIGLEMQIADGLVSNGSVRVVRNVRRKDEEVKTENKNEGEKEWTAGRDSTGKRYSTSLVTRILGFLGWRRS